jgi:hypothetical protein
MIMRADAMRILALTRSGVRKLEERGKLTATIGERGHHFFLRSDVIALAHARGQRPQLQERGKIAQRVFDLFETGYGLPDIVRQTGEAPATIRSLYEEWITPLGAKTKREKTGDDVKEAAEELARALERLGLNGGPNA